MATIVLIGVNQDFDSTWQGDAAFLEDKFVRFSYRFKFEDNEYSLMAPFSQPMFVPKQFSEFGGGQNSSTEDMDNAYKSTILTWFENDIDNIVLKSPMPYSTPALMSKNLLVTEIDLLYKESDGIAVKVLDTIKISSLTSSAFVSIAWEDVLSGSNTEYYYPYDYASSKPYKTLPSNQTTRVYDKVPIKALAQELIGNRVVYGNYVDKHSGPASIDFSALVDTKKAYSRNFIQYPYHNLKQNRTYQVGFVLSDRYGRQSDVILSSYDNIDGTNGSTVFSDYNTYNNQLSSPIIDWLGDTLQVKVDNVIGTQTGIDFPGQPGIWNATTNPLGWYSYKVVVKQQQQEYYNVYLPGFVNGLPITTSDEENKSAFSVLLSDNINKIPRDLNEVGPTDTEYSSSELLYIRVNNPDINNRSDRPYGYPQTSLPWNKQYFPGFVDQEVLSISTVKDMEIAAIPFVASAPEGDYGQVGQNQDATNPQIYVPVSIGSIPWGASPRTQPFYNSDLNPFAIKIDTTANGKVALNNTEVPIVPGAVGAITNANASGANDINTMVPFLSVAETKPVYSLLEIFWETSLQGKISTLNNLINSQFGGISSITESAATFLESAASGTKIGNSFSFVTGGGTTVVDDSFLTVSLESAFRASDINKTINVKSLFSIAEDGQALALYDLDTAATFWYSAASAAPLSSDVYNILIKVIYDDGGSDPLMPYTSFIPYTATLGNVAPTFDNTSNPTGITVASTVLKTYSAKNGSATVADRTKELIFDLDPSQANFSTINNQFTITSLTGVLSTNSALTEGQTYNVVVRVRDVDGNGLSRTTTATFTVGVQHVPKAICEGRKGSVVAACGESYQTAFLASSSGSTGTFPITINGILFPTPTYSYNVRGNASGSGTYTTGALTQGVMKITPRLTAAGAPSGGSVSLYYTIQRRDIGTTTWSQAVDTSNNVIGAIQLTASNGNPGTQDKLFSIIGEYRVVTTDITGGGCAGGGTIGYYTEFSDATYPGNCTGP